MSEYEPTLEGDEFPVGRKWKVRCCDCGLVHDFQFRVDKRNRIWIRVYKDTRATAAGRREKRKTMVRIEIVEGEGDPHLRFYRGNAEIAMAGETLQGKKPLHAARAWATELRACSIVRKGQVIERWANGMRLEP